MEPALEETIQSMQDFETISSWSYNPDDIKNAKKLIVNFTSIPQSSDMCLIFDVFSQLKTLVQQILFGSYKKQELEDILEFFHMIMVNSLLWGKNLSLGMFGDDSLVKILKVFAEVIGRIIGIEPYLSDFHRKYRKVNIKKHKISEKVTVNANMSKISLYFMSLFVKKDGLEFILKILLSE